MLSSETENKEGTFPQDCMADIVGTKTPVIDTTWCPYDATTLDSQVEGLKRDWGRASLAFPDVAYCYRRRRHTLMSSLVGFRTQARTIDDFRSFLVSLAVFPHQV
jgi:hypothetical protein